MDIYPTRVEKANHEWYSRELDYYNTLIAAYERDIDTTHELQDAMIHLVRNDDGTRKDEIDTQTAILHNMYSKRYDMLTAKVDELKRMRDRGRIPEEA